MNTKYSPCISLRSSYRLVYWVNSKLLFDLFKVAQRARILNYVTEYVAAWHELCDERKRQVLHQHLLPRDKNSCKYVKSHQNLIPLCKQRILYKVLALTTERLRERTLTTFLHIKGHAPLFSCGRARALGTRLAEWRTQFQRRDESIFGCLRKVFRGRNCHKICRKICAIFLTRSISANMLTWNVELYRSGQVRSVLESLLVSSLAGLDFIQFLICNVNFFKE